MIALTTIFAFTATMKRGKIGTELTTSSNCDPMTTNLKG